MSIFRLKMDITRRFFRIPTQSCFLFGPRGTGKSTWLKHELPRALHLDLLDPALHRRVGRSSRGPSRRPLRAFTDDYPEANAVLLHRGRERLRINGIWCVPVEEFLLNLAPGRGLLEA